VLLFASTTLTADNVNFWGSRLQRLRVIVNKVEVPFTLHIFHLNFAVRNFESDWKICKNFRAYRGGPIWQSGLEIITTVNGKDGKILVQILSCVLLKHPAGQEPSARKLCPKNIVFHAVNHFRLETYFSGRFCTW
jgi:hypothetical protein